MKRFLLLLPTLSLIAAFAVAPASSQDADATTTTPAAPPQVERGRYLVDKVAMCGQCHTSRDSRGELQTDSWLTGAPVPLTAPEGYEKWAYKAPRIAGLPQHTDEEFVRLMTTGINRDGKPPMAPMPPYRITEEDALAIAAYLRSLH